MPMFVKMGVSWTVTLIPGKTVKYIHFVNADVCWNGFRYCTGADICGLRVHAYLTNCFCNYSIFMLVCAQNWFVFDANFSSPNNHDWLFFKTGCWLSSCTKNFNKCRVTRKSIVLEFKIAWKCKSFLQKPLLTSK